MVRCEGEVNGWNKCGRYEVYDSRFDGHSYDCDRNMVFRNNKAVRSPKVESCKGGQPGSLLGANVHRDSGISRGLERGGEDLRVLALGRSKFPGWKRHLDLVLLFLGLPVWVSLCLIVGVWVRVSSPGPLIYRQERIGLGGRRFTILKFRSMTMDADQSKHDEYVQRLMDSGEPLTKLDAKGDARLIRGGGFLRASGLDELPQIINVIRGEMSLVGPRPCTPAELEKYKTHQQERFNAPPGVTGNWQVNGKNKTTFPEMVAMDIHYTRVASIWLDLAIVLRTPLAILEQLVERRDGQQLATQTSEETKSVGGSDDSSILIR